jgi:hypothetical protein
MEMPANWPGIPQEAARCGFCWWIALSGVSGFGRIMRLGSISLHVQLASDGACHVSTVKASAFSMPLPAGR